MSVCAGALGTGQPAARSLSPCSLSPSWLQQQQQQHLPLHATERQQLAAFLALVPDLRWPMENDQLPQLDAPPLTLSPFHVPRPREQQTLGQRTESQRPAPVSTASQPLGHTLLHDSQISRVRLSPAALICRHKIQHLLHHLIPYTSCCQACIHVCILQLSLHGMPPMKSLLEGRKQAAQAPTSCGIPDLPWTKKRVQAHQTLL